MKSLYKAVCLAAVSLLFCLLPLPAQEPSGLNKDWPREKQLAFLFNLRKPYDPKDLKTMVEAFSQNLKENKSLLSRVITRRQNQAYVISNNILVAAYKKNKNYQHLIKRDDLRKKYGHIDLALCVYDYSLNKSETALNKLLAQLATEPMGYDSTVIVMLSVMDEWDLTIRAYRKHFFRTDGAGASCMRHFREMREFLYPKKYKEKKDQIETTGLRTMPIRSKVERS